MSAPSYLDSLFSDIGGELEKKLNIIYEEFPQFYFTKSIFYHNQQAMRNALPAGLVWSDTMATFLKLQYKVLGMAELMDKAVYPWAHDFGDFADDLFRQNPNAERFDFIAVVDSTKKIFIMPGDWKLDRVLIIPGGYKVICREVTKIDLSNSANVISYSPIEWRGSEESPIVIASKDSTGEGVFVVNAQAPSFMEHVVFDNLSNPAKDGWALTGAVTFYESPVHISRCQFIGKITNTSFINCGNDGIDISGSFAEVDGIFVGGTGDKGVSSGEDSQLTGSNIDIKSASIGIASKDKSEVFLKNVKIATCEVGLTAYQKKPEFGAASIVAHNVTIGESKVPYLVEDNCAVTVDGKLISPNHKEVRDILYGVEYGKASKR